MEILTEDEYHEAASKRINAIGGTWEDRGPEWEKEYAKEAVGWPHLFDATNDHQFEVLLEKGLRPQHTVLDVGAGCLGVGVKLIEYLNPMNYTALEPDEWFVSTFEAFGIVLESFNFYQFGDFKLSRIKRKFNYVLAHSIFVHADRSQIRFILSETRKVLRVGGQLLASFYDQRHGDSEHEGWMYPNGVAYTYEFIERLANEAGFANVETIQDKRHPASHTWLFAS